MDERAIKVVEQVFGQHVRVAGGRQVVAKIAASLDGGSAPADVARLEGSGSPNDLLEMLKVIAEALTVAKVSIDVWDAINKQPGEDQIRSSAKGVPESSPVWKKFPDLLDALSKLIGGA